MRKAALKTLEDLVESDSKVVIIGSDLGAGTFVGSREKFPNRVLMEGIAEQHLVGFASGLALGGYKPFVHTISTFIVRRALEQVILDCALQKANVKLLCSGGGMVYAPLGPTHQSIDDYSHMLAIPGMIVFSPADPLEISQGLNQLNEIPGPCYIRIAKGGERTESHGWGSLEFGKARIVNRGKNILIISTGVVTLNIVEATEKLRVSDINPTHIHVPYLEPFDAKLILDEIKKHSAVIVVEEHIPFGGLYSLIADICIRNNHLPYFISHSSLPKEFATKYGSQEEHLRLNGLDAKSIHDNIVSIVGRN